MEWRTVGAKELYEPYQSVANFFKNNFEKPLDNQHKMCYNIRAVRDRNPADNQKNGWRTYRQRKAQKGFIMTNSVSSSNITMRQYHEAVLAIPGCPADVAEKARAEIAKLDAINAKRAEKAIEKAKENDPIKNAIYNLLVENGAMVASAIATELTTPEAEVSTSKASSMCRQMIEEGRLTVEDVKVKGKGKVKQYTAVVPAE